MHELLDLTRAVVSIVGLFWLVCVPGAWITGYYDDPRPRGVIDLAHKHSPAPGLGRNTGGGDIDL